MAKWKLYAGNLSNILAKVFVSLRWPDSGISVCKRTSDKYCSHDTNGANHERMVLAHGVAHWQPLVSEERGWIYQFIDSPRARKCSRLRARTPAQIRFRPINEKPWPHVLQPVAPVIIFFPRLQLIFFLPCATCFSPTCVTQPEFRSDRFRWVADFRNQPKARRQKGQFLSPQCFAIPHLI